METPRGKHSRSESKHPAVGIVVYFDGDCALCNRSVRFLLEHDRGAKFRFASLQSPMGLRLHDESSLATPGPGSILVQEGSDVLRESDAVLRLVEELDPPWSALAWAKVFPKSLRDAIYRWVARNRHRWFGASDDCALLRIEWKDRFLDGAMRGRDASAPPGGAQETGFRIHPARTLRGDRRSL